MYLYLLLGNLEGLVNSSHNWKQISARNVAGQDACEERRGKKLGEPSDAAVVWTFLRFFEAICRNFRSLIEDCYEKLLFPQTTKCEIMWNVTSRLIHFAVFIAGVTVARTVSGTATGRQALAGEMIEENWRKWVESHKDYLRVYQAMHLVSLPLMSIARQGGSPLPSSSKNWSVGLSKSTPTKSPMFL